jgi:hypothetical protein
MEVESDPARRMNRGKEQWIRPPPARRMNRGKEQWICPPPGPANESR